ncbi:hypothetical protein [Cryobacterium sp. PH31-L1]|uniref:hypothetical protein n=1 Tax=Cryobacterium sp. PH31-L1 TaxID=3046199 RepID=UPI0024BB7BB6|nr:hypothetical protein [Cryobacterium sp. PH31-L1]MDJ0376196.1 hypothetical protein [Cryobacterium sp. PH31-L1]
MRKLSKKAFAVAVTTAVLVGGSGVAFAFWTAGGSGTGTATAGTVTAITAQQTTTVAGLMPGVAAQTLSGTFTNSNTSPVYVSTVTASIASVVKDAGAVTGTCGASDFTLASPVMTVNAEVPIGGAGKGAWTGATLAFNDLSTVNQDACKNATVNLLYTIA